MSLIKTNKNGDLFPSFMSDFFDTDQFLAPSWFRSAFENNLPSANIKENANEFRVELAAPGFNKTDFKVNVENNVLTISAEKKEEKNEENERYTRREYSYNSFSRSFALPATAEADRVDAKYKDGILNLSIPKKEEAKALPKKEITVA